MIKESEFKRRMRVIGDFPNSRYKAKYPYNLLYWDGIRWWGDCVNIYKALLNGRDVDNPEVDTWQNDMSATGDCNEYGLISQCENVDGNFSNVNDGHVRILYMDGHIGGSFGEEFEVDGRIVNALECTTSWEGGGIVYSYVDTDGTRRHGKGYNAEKSWTLCGRPTKWVEADDEPEPSEENCEVILWTVKKGSNGGHVKTLQSVLNTKNNAGLDVDGDCGTCTEQAIKNYQSRYGITADGICGETTWNDILCRNV